MNYTVTNFDKNTAEITVKFNSNETIAKIILPVDAEGKVPTGIELETIINQFEPTKINVRNVTNSEEILGLVIPEINVTKESLSDLLSLKKESLSQLIQAVVNIRSQFITLTPGQDYSYRNKVIEATLFKQNNYLGETPSYIKEEISLTGESAKDCADKIIQKSNIWNSIIDPKIEAVRVFSNSKIIAADSKETLDKIKADYINIFGKIINDYKGNISEITFYK